MAVSDASNPYSVEGNDQILDPNADIDDTAEPGPLEEKSGEVSWPRPQNGPPKSGPHPDTGSVRQEHSAPAWRVPNPQQGPPEGPQLPTTSRVGGPTPHSDSAPTAGPRGSSSSELVPQHFTRSSQWQNMTPRARARHLWLLLRTGLHEFVEKEKSAELRTASLTHGLEPLRRLEVAAGLCSVAQDPAGRRFVVLDGAGCLHLHREDGWAHEKRLAPVALRGLVAVLGPLGSVGRFVGWGPLGLALLRPDLSLLWLSEPGVGRAPGREPVCCLPVPDLALLLVAEAGGGLALWKFRSGGRCLVSRGSPLRPPPSCTGAFVRLALGPLPPHHAPRCFAAYGSAVLTFDLQSRAVLDVRRDLHKTTISDLAYFREVEAVVTASRDSTVKVWEADWQIRMVFVGHTGPVTAMAVLPNTSLVLSASQDGTLRTWDLQAVAQVGEVALSCWGRERRSRRVNRLLAPAGPGWPVLSLRADSVELWRLRELYSPLAQLSAPVVHLQVAPALPLPLHPPLPTRLVCACADGSVCLVSAATGRTVSALLLEPDDCAAAVAYCLPRERLWLLTRAGQLVCANAARCPMSVLYRTCPSPPPAPRPCCLHLYSHLADPSSAFSSWEAVRQHGGELGRSDPGARKDKNRYLPVVGHTDGMLSVLEWRAGKSVFRTEAHSPGPVTAIASTWNSIVTSGGDLTVKMWRVFPYAEESLSLLHTFSCYHPAVALCVLGKCVTVAFEDPDSATYGLVQFDLGSSRRYDHRPQEDPMDHITGLCCCPMLELYASSSLDCTIRIWTAENHLLRLLQLNGAPRALTFCSDSGDLVLALGSRLCLVPHQLYLPTSYLIEKLCANEAPEAVEDPPLPLTGRESLTSAQLQRLASLHRVASLSVALSVTPLQRAVPQQPLLEEDLEALVARDQDLQDLRRGLVAPATQPPASWQQRQEAFDNYLRLIYGPGFLISLLLERRPKEVLSTVRGFFPASVQPYEDLALPIRFPGCVPNSVVLQQMWLPGEVRGPGALSQLTSSSELKQGRSQDGQGLLHRWGRWRRWRHTKRQRKLIQDLGEEGDEELELDWASDSSSLLGSLEDESVIWSEDDEAWTKSYFHRHLQYRLERSLWSEHYRHLPWFLQFFAVQSWFKKLFPDFNVEAYPEMSTDDLVSKFMDKLKEASWADRVHILHALLRLMPDMSGSLCGQLHCILLQLLNLGQPPSLQDHTQKLFIMLALQLLLACSLESREVVLELLSYFLYSPASCQPELKNLLDGLGLQDPDGFLFKEMMSWVQGPDLGSKSTLRGLCRQKLEEMIQSLQVWMKLWPPGARLSERLPKVPEPSALPPSPKEAPSPISAVSGAPTPVSSTPLSASFGPLLVVSPGASEAQPMPLQGTKRPLSETLLPFASVPEVRAHSFAAPAQTLPLEQTPWSHSKMVDLEPIDALNYFCEQQRAQRRSALEEEPEEEPARRSLSLLSPRPPAPTAVVPQPWDRLHPILRLQETKTQRSPASVRGQTVSRFWEGRPLNGAIRTLKLPLPRVDLQPFPPAWPRPARPLPPLLLQPTLQRYFWPDHADPDNYS